MNKPDVLLVNLPYIVKNIDSTRPKLRSFLCIPYGLLSVATYCRDLANIRIVDCDTIEGYQQTIIREMQMFKPSIVGFSMMMDCSYGHLSGLLRLVREIDPKVLTVLGGAAASYSYEEILLEQPLLDAVCYSEGEVPFRNLLLNPGTWPDSFVTIWDIKKNVHISYIENLDDVIDIDYSFVNPSAYNMQEAFSPFAHKEGKRFFLCTSRGCFGKCTFCSNVKIHGRKVRQASVSRIINHVKYLVDNYGMDVLVLYDDQLLFNKNRAKDLFRQLAQFKLRIDCPNGLSVAFIDDELAKLMAEAGLDTAMLAIESGSEYVLRELINKPLRLHMVKPAIEMLHKYGIFCHGFFVMGYPGETDLHRMETRKFIENIDLDWCGFNMVTPVRGSKLYDDCIKNGWISKQKISEIVDKKYIINVPGTNPEKIEQDVYQMNLDFNFHQNRRMRIGDYKTAAACFRQVMNRYSGHELARHYLDICESKIKENT